MGFCDDLSNSYQRSLHRCANAFRLRGSPLLRASIAEMVGTCILVVFGCGVLAQVILGNDGKQEYGTFISISLGWGMAVTFGVMFSGISGSGHVNPALTLAFSIIGRFPICWVPFYWIGQFVGAFLGSLIVYGIYFEKILAYAAVKHDGNLTIESTGVIFVTYPYSSATTCFLDQAFCAAILAAGILAISDANGFRMPNYVQPLYIGLLVYTILGCFSLNVGCALNPARDLGPRLMIFLLGWGGAAFSASNFYFWIPLVAPFVGAIIGSVLYEATIGIHYDRRPPAVPAPRVADIELQQAAEGRSLLP